MKTIISSILCFVLTCLPLNLNAGNTNSIHPQFAVLEVVVGLTILVVGTATIIKVWNVMGRVANVTLVLEKSTDHSSWTPIYTNTVTLYTNSVDATTFFQEQMTDSTAFYRAHPL